MSSTQRSLILAIVFTCGNFISLLSQCDNPPNGESCLCSTAPILCTPDELDGFTFSMSSATNLGDLPAGFNGDLCPGINNQDGVPNNVNFFAFIAWCTDLTFDVQISNCLDNPSDNFESYGIQMALFANCGSQFNGWNPVECLTEGDDTCFNTAAEVPTVQTFDMTGLTIGNVYYFMLDGCARSTCDITIDVDGVCGTGMIDDWTTGITGEQNACVGVPYTYSAEDLNGAVEFYYYIDGVLTDDGVEQTTFNHTWATPGTYELCVDVSNLPCIEEIADPAQNCITVEVYELLTGDLEVDPQPACPSEELTITLSNYSPDPELSNVLYVVDENGVIVQVVMGDMTTALYDECATWTVYAYQYITADMPTIQSVGDTYSEIECGGVCCEVEELEFSWGDDDPPVLTGVMPDITVDCADDVLDAEAVTFMDNCVGTGTVEPELTSNFTNCDGGTITRTWTVADSCDNTASETQTVTIDPIPLAVWSMTPMDETVACTDAPTSFPDLMLSNSASSTCLIDETITPSIDNTNLTPCGGSIVATWSFTDLCAREYEIIQTVTVDPPLSPAFQSMPADVTIQCGEAVPPPVDILVTNGSTGNCLLEMPITPVVEDNTDGCDGTITYTWTYSDACSNMLDYTQTITLDPPAEPVFIDAPGPITFPCDAVIDPIDLTVDNGLMGTCQIMDIVSPTSTPTPDACGGDIVHTWTYTDVCDRTITHMQTVTIEAAAEGVFVGVPADITIDCGDVAGNPVDLVFTNSGVGGCLIEETVSPTVVEPNDYCGGDLIYTWEFTDDCDRTVTENQIITINPAQEANWINPPDPINISCDDFLTTPPNLLYTNGLSGFCEIAGNVPGILIGNPTACGNTVMYMWTFTDECDRTIEHTQDINITEATLPTFDDLPQDMTVPCSLVSDFVPDLTYSNGQTGDCSRSGVAPPVTISNYDACGGILTHTWTATDDCGYSFSHMQTITVTPADPPVFTAFPEDITLACEGSVPDPIELTYTNGETSICLIEGEVTADVEQDGLVTTYTWTYTTDCDPATTITHVQNITEAEEPQISIDPESVIICQGETFDLATVNVANLNGDIIAIEYQTDFGDLLQSSVVQPNATEFYNIVIYNESLCFDFATIMIEVEPQPEAGTGTTGSLCAGTQTISLFDYLTGSYVTFGTWFDTDNTGVNINDPNSVNLSSLANGTYQFDYEVEAGTDCPPITATIFIQIVEAPTADILSVECDDAGGNYTVSLVNLFGNVMSTVGTIDVNGNSATISNIPISSPVTITFSDGADCNSELTIEPPVCDCPTIPAPMTTANSPICLGESITLAVTVENGLVANWYDTSSGGTLLIGNSLTYTPTLLAAGTYTYYVQAVDAQGCLSTLRTPVNIDVIAPPIANMAMISLCEGANGQVSINLAATVNSLINTNTSFTYEYYNTLVNAENGSDPIIPQVVTTSVDLEIFAKVITSQGCSSVVPFSVMVLPAPDYSFIVQNEQCAGEDDGSIEISNLSGDAQFALNDTMYSATTLFSDLEPGTYILNSKTSQGCFLRDTIIIGEGPNFGISNVTPNCDNNGTVLDPQDDSYTISFDVNGADASDIEVTDLSGITLTVNMGPPMSFMIAADAEISNSTYVVTDLLSGCVDTLQTGPLSPCSTDCSFEVSPLSPLCNGNGTPTDPTDDFYTIDFTLTAINGNAADYILTINNNVTATYSYGTAQSIQVAATTDPVTITFTDIDDNQCFQTFTFDDLSPCSNECILNILDLDISCDNNMTSDTELDDVTNITFGLDPINTPSDSATVTIDGNFFGNFPYGENVALSLSSDGLTHTIVVSDSGDDSCRQSFEVDYTYCSTCEGSVEAGPDGELTCDITMITLTGNSDPVGLEFWTDPSGQIIMGNTISANSIGTYYFSADYGDNCVISDSLTITTDDSVPTALAGDDQIFDCDTDSLTLTGNIMGGTGPFTYTWTDAQNVVIATTSSVTIYAPGVYSLSVFDQTTGCNSPIDAVNVIDKISGPSAVIYTDPADEIDCVIEVIFLTSDEEGGTVYNWFVNGVPAPAENLNITEGADIILVAIDTLTGCENMDFISIPNLIEYPLIVIGSLGNLDCATEIVEIDASGSQMGDDISSTWYDLDGNILATETLTYQADSVGDYVLELIDNENGCENRDTVSIIDVGDRPEIEFTANVNIPCDAMNPSIAIDVDDALSNISITWISIAGNILTGQGTEEVTVDGPGIYQATVLNIDNGCDAEAAIEVSYPEQIADVEVLTADENCEGNQDGSVSISVIAGGTAPFAISIDDETIEGNEVMNLSAGIYTLAILDGNNCLFDTSFEIGVLPPFEITLPSTLEIVQGNAATFTANTSIPDSEIASISWSPSEGLDCDSCKTVTYLGTTSASFTVTIIDIDGCQAESSIEIVVEPTFDVYFPNIFNVSGRDNSRFYPITNDPEAIVNELSIYDRWGNKVFTNENFQPNQPELGWDGSFGSTAAEQGVYVYYTAFTFGNGNRETKSGDVTLFR